MTPYLLSRPMDFERHNEEVRRVWQAYEAGNPERAPVQFSMNVRMVVQNPELNTAGWTFRAIFEQPTVRWEAELALAKWVRLNVLQDAEMGYPERWPGMSLSLLNCDEAAWFGCPIVYPGDDMPFVEPILAEDKSKLGRMRFPDGPFSGALGAMLLAQREHLERRRERETFEGIPVGKTAIPLAGTDGPFTVACNLRGAANLALDISDDPAFVRDLLAFVTDGIISRIRKVRELAGRPCHDTAFSLPDDSIEWLSPDTCREFVFPCHRRIMDAFSGEKNCMHLCGNPRQHFAFVVENLGITILDLGFPTDMGRARRELGRGVTLIGNIAPHLLRSGPPEAIREAVRQLCASGVMEGGRFILHDGNNCVPLTPVEHFAAMYEAGKEFGRYGGEGRGVKDE